MKTVILLGTEHPAQLGELSPDEFRVVLLEECEKNNVKAIAEEINKGSNTVALKLSLDLQLRSYSITFFSMIHCMLHEKRFDTFLHSFPNKQRDDGNCLTWPYSLSLDNRAYFIRHFRYLKLLHLRNFIEYRMQYMLAIFALYSFML